MQTAHRVLVSNHQSDSQLRWSPIRQLSLIIILSRLVYHHKLREIRCELLLAWRSCVPRVLCSCNAPLRTIFKLPSWHYHPTPLTLTNTDAHTHIDVCACAGLLRWSSASTMPLYGCMTHRPVCPTRVDFHSWSSLVKHVFPTASIMSCHVLCLQAVLHLTYTVHVNMQQTPAYLKEPIPFLHMRLI